MWTYDICAADTGIYYIITIINKITTYFNDVKLWQ